MSRGPLGWPSANHEPTEPSRRLTRMPSAVASAIALIVGVWSASAMAQQEPYDLRAGAWDQSVRLEQSGDVKGARDLLMRAWGASSDSYEVTMRLAYLENKLGNGENALALYRRAKTMPGAGDDVNVGLSAALTVEGYSRLDDGDRAGARECFEQALAAEPGAQDARDGLAILGGRSRVDPELWGAYINQTVQPDKFSGWALFMHLPWWVSDSVKLRLAGRYVQTSGSAYTGSTMTTMAYGPGSSRNASKSTTESQGEGYASIGWYPRYVGIELMGGGLFRKGDGFVPLQAAALRLGGRAGVNVEQAAIFGKQGVGIEVLPQLYWWPSRSFGLAGGPRITHDPRGDVVSAVAGISAVGRSAGLYVQGHLGTERWPVTMAAPSVLALDGELTAGLTATTTFRLSESWQLGLQGQWERVEVPDFDGSYYTLSTGLIWSP